MKKFLVLAGIIIVVVIGWLIISKINPSPQEEVLSPAVLAEVPDFALQDYSGKTVSRADFSGKPLVINSWAGWCPFCREELVAFAVAQEELGDQVVIIAINRAESLDTAKGYTDEQGTSDKLVFLLDPTDSFYQSIDGFSMPETIFVDKNGNIVDHKRGPMDIDEIRSRTQKIL
ncbi:MAG: TlpA family protein disulfide reductase [Parcubacteria group bacterium]|nr:TlpA family protein disulfide reductase [Parcubacteria group bacterium]